MKCYCCNSEAIGNYTTGIDSTNAPFCKKHKDDIGSSFLWDILGVHELWLSSLLKNKKNERRNNKVSKRKKPDK